MPFFEIAIFGLDTLSQENILEFTLFLPERGEIELLTNIFALLAAVCEIQVVFKLTIFGHELSH